MSEIPKSGVYSNIEILEAIEHGHIIQHPFTPELINASSVDVRLGNHFFRTDINNIGGMYNPYDEEEVKRYFGEPLEAVPFREHGFVQRELGIRAIKGIDPDHPVIMIRPHERILAHTYEFIGIKAPGTSSMQAKSTTGRNGIVVCKDAGWGDPGFFDRWTMEIQNDNDEFVPLPVGVPIAQIVFYHTGEVKGDYTTLSGNYQSSSDIDQLVREWNPYKMLPKSYKQVIKLPPRILELDERYQ